MEIVQKINGHWWTLVTACFLYYSSFGSRSVLVRFSIDSRSFSVHSPFILRSGIEDRSKIDRRTNGESSEAKRRRIETLMGNQGKGDPNKNFIFYHLIQIVMARLTPNFITFLHHHIARIENQ